MTPGRQHVTTAWATGAVMTADEGGRVLGRGELRLTSTAAGRYRCELDGVDLSKVVHSVRLTVEPGRPASAVVELLVYDVSTMGVEAVVYLPDATRELLLRAGWTPPAAPREP